MASGSLTSDWFTPTSYLDPLLPLVSITGTGSVEFLWSVGAPAGAAAGLPIVAGVYQLGAPSSLHRLYFRVTSGSATLNYQAQTAALFDTSKTGYAYSGGSGSDKAWIQSAGVLVGFDNLTTRSAANPYEFNGYLTTSAVGLTAGASVFSAWLTLSTPSVTAGRTMRVYGIKYATDQSGNITSWDTLQSRTKTTAYADLTTRAEGQAAIDVKSIVQELQGVSGWADTSPIQFYVKDNGSAATGANTTMLVNAANSDSSLIIALTSGASPEPPTPGTGGP